MCEIAWRHETPFGTVVFLDSISKRRRKATKALDWCMTIIKGNAFWEVTPERSAGCGKGISARLANTPSPSSCSWRPCSTSVTQRQTAFTTTTCWGNQRKQGASSVHFVEHGHCTPTWWRALSNCSASKNRPFPSSPRRWVSCCILKISPALWRTVLRP